MQLDFSIFPNIESKDMLWRLPSEELKCNEEVYCRAVAALYMIDQMCAQPKRSAITKNIHIEAYFRAALVEFVGIEEVLKRQGYTFRINKLTNPIFHILRLLRNYQVQISSVNFNKKAINIFMGGDRMTAQYEVINNLSVEKFMELHAIKKRKEYNKEQVCKMIENFEVQQNRLGVATLLDASMKLFFQEILQLITRPSI